jgi:hypothetical protein
MAAKAAFSLASFEVLVSEDWVVEKVRLKLVTHHPVIEPVSGPAPGTEICNAETGS